MYISILKLEEPQKIARPWNRASSRDELKEMVEHFVRSTSAHTHGKPVIKYGNLDTEEPVLTCRIYRFGGVRLVKMYAFTE